MDENENEENEQASLNNPHTNEPTVWQDRRCIINSDEPEPRDGIISEGKLRPFANLIDRVNDNPITIDLRFILILPVLLPLGIFASFCEIAAAYVPTLDRAGNTLCWWAEGRLWRINPKS